MQLKKKIAIDKEKNLQVWLKYLTFLFVQRGGTSDNHLCTITCRKSNMWNLWETIFSLPNTGKIIENFQVKGEY